MLESKRTNRHLVSNQSFVDWTNCQMSFLFFAFLFELFFFLCLYVSGRFVKTQNDIFLLKSVTQHLELTA